jgi:hypothetical protein
MAKTLQAKYEKFYTCKEFYMELKHLRNENPFAMELSKTENI